MGRPKHRTVEMLFDKSKEHGKEADFERTLYEAFKESPDPLQLMKILKRKLKGNDKDQNLA